MTDEIVFGTKWFEKHQRKLLWLLNFPLVKILFRYCLRILKQDLPRSTKIIKILPNCFTWSEGEFLKTDFRTHDKYSKRLYFAFKPIWYMLHFFDWFLLDRFKLFQALSFGFHSLTAYPSPNTVQDGYVYRTANESFSSKRSGTGTEVYDDDGDRLRMTLSSHTTTNEYAIMARGILPFNTSSIKSFASISAAVLSLNSYNETLNGLGDISIHIAAGNSASITAIATSDYNQANHSTTSFGSFGYSGWSSGVYKDLSLNASGIAFISKTSYTIFSMQNNWDISASAPTWVSGTQSYIFVNSSNASGTSIDPKLVLTYTNVFPNLAANSGAFTLSGQIANLVWHVINRVATLSAGAFTLTGQVLSFTQTRILAMGAAAFTLTGRVLTFVRKWRNRIKNATTWTNRDKN